MTNHIRAILWKQIKDTLKNKTILTVMYAGMAPLTSAAAIISGEKEKGTLYVLQMCNLKAVEYLIGNAIYIVFICMTGSLVIGLAGGYTGQMSLLVNNLENMKITPENVIIMVSNIILIAIVFFVIYKRVFKRI